MVRLKTVVAAGALVTASLLTAVPAYAQSTYVGKVTANGGLTVRHLPTTASAIEGKLNNGQQIEIICKVRGSSVNGNDSWYSLPPTLNESGFRLATYKTSDLRRAGAEARSASSGEPQRQ